jgi:hypothetical protein
MKAPLLVGTAIAVVSLAGCGSSAVSAPAPLHAAPEPAKAPALRTAPSGTVVPLPTGSEPEGAVYDPESGDFAVALRNPDRLAIVDSRNSIRYVSVPASARHLELAAPGHILVPGEDTNQVLTVQLPAGAVVASISTPRQPHDVGVISLQDWYVANEFGASVIHVVGGRSVATFGGDLQPGGAGAADGTVGVVDVRARLLLLFRDGKPLARLPAGAGPTHVVGIGGGRLVVADTLGGRLLVYDVTGKPRMTASISVPGQPYGLTFDPARDEVWVTRTGGNVVECYAITKAGLVLRHTYATVQNAYSVAVDEKTATVLIAGENPARLQLLHR